MSADLSCPAASTNVSGHATRVLVDLVRFDCLHDATAGKWRKMFCAVIEVCQSKVIASTYWMRRLQRQRMEEQVRNVRKSYWRPGLAFSTAAVLAAAHSIVVITSARSNAIFRTRTRATVRDRQTSLPTAPAGRRLSTSFQMRLQHPAKMTYQAVQSHATKHYLVVISVRRSAMSVIAVLVYKQSLSTADVGGRRIQRCATKDEMKHPSACAFVARRSIVVGICVMNIAVRVSKRRVSDNRVARRADLLAQLFEQQKKATKLSTSALDSVVAY